MVNVIEPTAEEIRRYSKDKVTSVTPWHRTREREFEFNVMPFNDVGGVGYFWYSGGYSPDLNQANCSLVLASQDCDLNRVPRDLVSRLERLKQRDYSHLLAHAFSTDGSRGSRGRLYNVGSENILRRLILGYSSEVSLGVGRKLIVQPKFEEEGFPIAGEGVFFGNL